VAKDDAKRASYTRAKAQAELTDAQLVFREHIEAAAERIADQLEDTRGVTPELGFLDDVLDVLEAVGHAVERLVEDIFTLEGPVIVIGDCGITLAICGPILVEAGEGFEGIERSVTGASKPGQTSAEQLLAGRQALLARRDRGRKRLTEIVQAIRGPETVSGEEDGNSSGE
jgi:hypothetical protein